MFGGSRSARVLAGTLASAGIAHFAVPERFDRVVPASLPGPARTWTYASGLAELLVAGAVACPRTRRAGGVVAAGLFAAVFPANVKMAYDWRGRSPGQRALAYGRLPLQIPLVAWGLAVSRGADRRTRA